MAANPRVVTEDVTFTWDGASQRLAKGQLIDVPAGSELEAAIGTEHLEPVLRAGSTALAQEPTAPPASSAAAGRKKTGTADGKDTP